MNDAKLLHLRQVAADRNSPRVKFSATVCRTERMAAGLTTTDLASICGATERTAERWERGKSNPNSQALVRLQRILGAWVAQ